jgi:hypothetical protein
MYQSREDAINCPKGDLIVVEDSITGLIYNQAFNQELLKYDEHYQNEQALSPAIIAHHNF